METLRLLDQPFVQAACPSYPPADSMKQRTIQSSGSKEDLWSIGEWLRYFLATESHVAQYRRAQSGLSVL